MSCFQTNPAFACIDSCVLEGDHFNGGSVSSTLEPILQSSMAI